MAHVTLVQPRSSIALEGSERPPSYVESAAAAYNLGSLQWPRLHSRAERYDVARTRATCSKVQPCNNVSFYRDEQIHYALPGVSKLLGLHLHSLAPIGLGVKTA